MRIAISMILASLLAACASVPEPQFSHSEVYLRHASEETVSGVRYTSVRGWRPVSDEGVLIEFNGQRHFLFSLLGACRSQVNYAESISFMRSAVNRIDQLDRIYLGRRACLIEEIREVDFDAVQAELQALEMGVEPPREASDSDVIHRDDYSGGT